jgi:hypothetical protein
MVDIALPLEPEAPHPPERIGTVPGRQSGELPMARPAAEAKMGALPPVGQWISRREY